MNDHNVPNKLPNTQNEGSYSLRCRICMDSSSCELLISPCLCTGTVALVHKSCLERWLNCSQTVVCDLCGYEFRIQYNNPTIWKWLRQGGSGDHRYISQRRHFWTDAVCLSIMLALLGVCLWQTTVASLNSASGAEFEALQLSLRYHVSSFTMWQLEHRELHIVPTTVPKRNVESNSRGQVQMALSSNSTVTSTPYASKQPLKNTLNDAFSQAQLISPVLPAIPEIRNTSLFNETV